MFTADHLSPTQLNKNIDQWFYDYCKLTAAERKKLKPNLKMIFGGFRIKWSSYARHDSS